MEYKSCFFAISCSASVPHVGMFTFFFKKDHFVCFLFRSHFFCHIKKKYGGTCGSFYALKIIYCLYVSVCLSACQQF